MFGKCKHCKETTRRWGTSERALNHWEATTRRQDRQISTLERKNNLLETALRQYDRVVHTYKVILGKGSHEFSVRADRVRLSELGTQFRLQGKLAAFVPANELFSVVADSDEEVQSG